ncbi:MAG: RES domain-containing protein [Acidimicrobiales bacterium]|nr:RES domain-containing protein [Acidimicrobiales bacterium]
MLLYRVVPWLPDARVGAPGHPAHVPPGGAGRVDNPDRYQCLYLSDAAAGAVAEVFWFERVWTSSMLRGRPSLPGSVQAIATYELPDDTPICDLDDAHRLVDLGLRPSQVVTRDRRVTQAWARAIHAQSRWHGVSWWSYHDPRWSSHGIWHLDGLTPIEVSALRLDHPGLLEAADVLARQVEG